MPVPIIQEGSFNAAIRNQINQNFQMLAGTTGNVYYLNPNTGADTNVGTSPATAVKTLAAAYALCTAGNNDIVVLVGNGSTTATARLSAGFTWAKNATHLVGLCSESFLSLRARIAPTSGATAFANFFTVSASGCYFSNLQWFHGFGTGTTAQICMTVSGGRNTFYNCDLDGMGDAASAQDTGSRNLLLQTTGENYFNHCSIGIDTVARTVANASVEFKGGCPRNVFEDCLFPIWATNAGVLGVYTAAAAASDRFQMFKRCVFVNSLKSGAGTAMTALSTLAASQGGLHYYKDCSLIGVSGWGTDATSKAQMYIDGYVPSNASGISVNPA